jgi:flavin reductase (DIM6/NTAB) family NADH-FMN oxidoreductase RutF
MLLDLTKEKHSISELYRLVTSCAVPRPIALVSTVSAEGINNVSPYSYFNFVSTDPLMLMFAPILDGKGIEKDSHRNAEATKEFVVAVVTEAMAIPVNQSSASYPRNIDEFKETGLTPGKALHVKAPLVMESPVNFECKLHDIIRLGTHPYAGNIVIGEVIAIHIKDGFVTEKGTVDPDKLKAIGRMGQSGYVRTSDRFDLARPKLPEGA